MERELNATIFENEGKYGVKLPQFEGPLDLLLHLIRKEKIDIYDIPIALITERYLEYIKLMEDLNITVAAEFLEMAATLIYIKSKMLLPVEDTEEEEEFEDPRKELVERLIEHEKFQDLAQELYVINEIEGGSYHKGRMEKILDENEELVNVTIFDLIDAYKNILKKLEERKFEIIERDDLTVEMAISNLKEKLEKKNRLSFFSLIRDGTLKMVVTYFIAILEICRQKIVKLKQTEDYSDIILVKNKRKD